METVTVNVHRAGGAAAAAPDLDVDLARARRLAHLMDSQFSLAGVKFGLDSIVGLLPVVGDSLAAAVSLYPIWVARRHHLGQTVQARMALNVLMDWLPGMLPLVGDVIDVAFKANLKNLKLLERAAEKRRRK